MVEKIIINPNKVRGYGNIMSPHSTSDYETYASSITSGTDTVNGVETTVYTMTDTIIFWDKGTSTDYSAWASSTTMNITRDSECTTVTPVDSSVFSSRYLTITTDDCTIEFDVKCSNVSEAFFSIRQNGTSKKSFFPSTCGISADTWYHIQITIEGTAVTLYNDGVQKDTGTADSHNRFYFTSNANVSNNIKYKNFKIYR